MRAWMTYGAVIAALLGSAQAATAGDLFPNVLVTVPAYKPYVDELLHGITESKNLLRPEQDAHSFSLSSSQRVALDAADIIIIPDAGMSPFLNKLLDTEKKRGAIIVTLSDMKGAEALPYAKENPWLTAANKQAGISAKEYAADGDEDEAPAKPTKAKKNDKPPPKPLFPAAKTDPHLWLDPIRMAALAEPLAEIVATRSPSNRSALQANAKTLANHLRNDVDPAIRAIFKQHEPHETMSSKPVVPFITYHAAYQYFMKRYGLEDRGEIVQRPEDYLGARNLRDILAKSERITMHCVISESDSPLVRRVASASGAKIITLSPETAVNRTEIASAPWTQNDYDRLLQKTAESFAGCL